jgi:DNA-binding LacI/PurR family transcriptional regulator
VSRRRSNRVTIRDVADQAGVSIGTVSLALSDNPDVADATKERVRDTAMRLGYQPSAAGQALRAGRMNAVGLVIPHSGQHVFSHLYFMQVLSGMSRVLNEADMTLILSTASEETDEDTAYVKVLRSLMVDGVVLASFALRDPHIGSLKQRQLPFVVIGRYPQDASVPAVGVDDFGGAHAATVHLIEHGHRRIAHICGQDGHLSAMDRREGYITALREHGLDVRPEYMVGGDYSEEAGRAGMRMLLDLSEPPTAIFAGNDETAIGAMTTLRDAGIEPGRDFAVVGFDDVRFAAHVTPPLTTVRQPMDDLGAAAARLLLHVLDGDDPTVTQSVLPTSLVVRDSCGCAGGREGRAV